MITTRYYDHLIIINNHYLSLINHYHSLARSHSKSLSQSQATLITTHHCSSSLGGSSHLVSRFFHPNYKWINPTKIPLESLGICYLLMIHSSPLITINHQKSPLIPINHQKSPLITINHQRPPWITIDHHQNQLQSATISVRHWWGLGRRGSGLDLRVLGVPHGAGRRGRGTWPGGATGMPRPRCHGKCHGKLEEMVETWGKTMENAGKYG